LPIRASPIDRALNLPATFAVIVVNLSASALFIVGRAIPGAPSTPALTPQSSETARPINNPRNAAMTVRHFTSNDAKFFQYLDKEIFVGDVLDPSNSDNMSVGFYRNKTKGEKNEWVVTYDEVLIVTKGALTIRYSDGVKTAQAGEVIFLTKGTAIAYEAGEDDTEVVYVSYPHWMNAQAKSKHAHLLDSYHPV
jgi:ethanolamine utilization protein EutQ